ncbi:hypothetical protein ACQRAU_05325 [Slackia isoflavoniconvertens]
MKRLNLRRLMESAQALEEEILYAFKERCTTVRKIKQLSGKLVSGEFLHILD